MEILLIIGGTVLFVLVLIMIANYSGENFVHAFFAMQEKADVGFTTALEFTKQVINKEFDGEITIARTEKLLADAYNPGKRVIILSNTTIHSASSISLAIAAHELGHAQQQIATPKKFNRFLFARAFSAKVSSLILPLIVIGAICMIALQDFWIGAGLAIGGMGIFLLCIAVRLATIPIERDASKRGIELMKKYSEFSNKELRQAKKLLRLALLTYIGDFLRIMLMWTGLVKKTRL